MYCLLKKYNKFTVTILVMWHKWNIINSQWLGDVAQMKYNKFTVTILVMWHKWNIINSETWIKNSLQLLRHTYKLWDGTPPKPPQLASVSIL